MNYLAVDYGEKNIGLAIGSDETKLALPFTTIRCDTPEEAIQRLCEISVKEGVDAFVLGIPLHSSHSQDQKNKTEGFANALRAAASIPVYTIDESFTSKQAARHVVEAGSIGDEHAIAAMLILEGFFLQKHSASP
ncbi:Holliday junction resolvase RuvX [Candidatus Uhrbacteria bacterium]|nr:Holliday junction resolvase RuvX [Candidatus Uhrbacteria bacterium]